MNLKRRHLWTLLLLVAVLSCASASRLDLSSGTPVPKDRLVCDDGDTFTFDDTTVRILGIDTPEIAHPEHGFLEDQPYGREAARRAEELLRGAKEIVIFPYQEDRYGRLLAHVLIDGELFGVKMVEEGLAYETVSYYGDNGFPEFAAALLEAAKKAPAPAFMPPHQWRREHRVDPVPTGTE
jgi:endonuclease YncB( thermonuclease family)